MLNRLPEENKLDESSNEFFTKLSSEEKAIIQALPNAFHKYCITPAISSTLFNKDNAASADPDYEIDKTTGIRCATYAKTTWWKSLLSYIPIISWIFTKRVFVPAGSLALIVNRGTPEFLGQGYHVLLDPWSEYKETVNLLGQHDRIYHGTAQIILVAAGQVAVVLDKKTGKYYFLTQGTHTFDSAAVEYKRHIKDISEKNITIDQLRFFKVTEGNVAVTADARGRTKTYKHGMHEIPPVEKLPVDISIKNRVIENLEKHTETSDNFNVNVKATVYYKITNPELAVSELGYMDNIEKMIKDQAQSALGAMVRTLSFNELGQAHDYTFYHDKYRVTEYHPQPSAPPIFTGEDTTSDDSTSSSSMNKPNPAESKESPPNYAMTMSAYIMDELNKNYFSKLGIEITSLAVDSVLPANRETEARLSQLSQQKAETKLAAEMADFKAATNKRAAESKQETDMIVAQTEQRKKEMETGTEAKKMGILAQAEADRETKLAEAKANNIKAIAAAEVEAGKMLQSCPVAADLRKLELITRAVNQASTIYATDASIASMHTLFGGIDRNRRVQQLPRNNSEPQLTALAHC